MKFELRSQINCWFATAIQPYIHIYIAHSLTPAYVFRSRVSCHMCIWISGYLIEIQYEYE